MTTITSQSQDKLFFGPLFDMLPNLEFIGFPCVDTNRHAVIFDAHTHDGGICVLDPELGLEAVYDTNPGGLLVPSTKMLHEYAHIVAPEEYHHHGILWQTAYAALCDHFGMEPETSPDRFAGEWGQLEELEYA